jgi:glycosyltransferase involved in cell wall biosynthesis
LDSREIAGRVWLRGLERRIAQIRPDVVHCHNVLQFHTVRLALVNAMGRHSFALLVDEHTQISIIRKSRGGRLFYQFYGIVAQPLIGRYVAHYSAKNEGSKWFMETACRIRKPIEIITLGVDVDGFVASTERRRDWRLFAGVPQDALLFLYTGKLIPAKGIDLLIRAATKLLRDGISIHVALVGDAESRYLETMRALVSQAGLENRFHFLPSVPHGELPSVYAAADVAVWPRQETIAVLEALSTSLPVIINSSNGYAPIVERGAGLVFDADDESSLAHAMLSLAEPSRRQAMGAVGRDVVCGSYSWRQCAERYLDAYQRALQP